MGYTNFELKPQGGGGGGTFLYPKSVFQVALSLCIVMLAQLG